MAFARQIVLGVAVLAAAFWFWGRHVPAAAPWLEAMGLGALVVPADAGAAGGGGGGGWGGGRGGAVAVVTAEVAEARLGDSVLAIGDGRALRAVTLRPEVSGVIREIGAGPGDAVQAGDLIVALDDAAQQIALSRARLMVEDAAQDLARLTRLVRSGAATDVQLRAAELARRTAELALEEAEHALGQRQVRAPIAGQVGLLDIEIGDRVSTQTELATITDRSAVLVDFRVPERVVARLEPGMAFTAAPLAEPGAALPGTITAIDTVVDRASRTLRVQGRLENADDALRAGMAFSVRLDLPGAPAPAVDPLAVQWARDGAFVWVAREDKAVKVPVIIRQRNAGAVLVEAALSPGERVVTEGVQSLRPGAELRVVGAEPGASAAEGL